LIWHKSAGKVAAVEAPVKRAVGKTAFDERGDSNARRIFAYSSLRVGDAGGRMLSTKCDAQSIIAVLQTRSCRRRADRRFDSRDLACGLYGQINFYSMAIS